MIKIEEKNEQFERNEEKSAAKQIVWRPSKDWHSPDN